jgi:putative membrane protein
MLLGVIRGAPSTLLGIPAMLAMIARADLWLILTGTAVAVSSVAFARWLVWYRFTYALTSDAVIIESGLLSRNRRMIPYERVADVGIERRPLQRLFGLASVTLETGGAGADEGALDSVALVEAERLRDVVRSRRGATSFKLSNVEMGESRFAARPISGAVPIFTMSTRRVLFWGLFNFSLVGIVIGFGALQSVSRALEWNGDVLWNAMVTRTGMARSMPALAWAGATAAGSAIILAIGIATGLIRAILREHGFRLTDEGGRLRRTRGLFTRSEAVLSLPRVQLVMIDTGFVRRRLGWSRLRAQVLGGEGAGGRQDLAPMARAGEVDALLAVLRLAPIAPGDMEAVARGHIWRALLRRVGLPAMVIAGATLAKPLALLASPLLLPLIVAATLSRRHHRYRAASGLLHVQRGVFSRTTWIVPIVRIQALSLRRSWLQRRLGLATLLVDAAGGGGRSCRPDVHDLSEADAWTLMADLRATGSGVKTPNNTAPGGARI